jgi:hypothetical protein
MSLDYDLSKIIDRDKSDEGWNVTQTIIFGCMITDIGTITRANYHEWFARYMIINPTARLTIFDVRKHIGLHTNVPNRTQPAWIKRMIIPEIERIGMAAMRAEREAGNEDPMITNEREADRPHDFEREDDDHCAICGEPRHAPQHQ